MNILLELDKNEWIFSFVSNVAIQTQIQKNSIRKIKPKFDAFYTEQCKTCSEDISINIYCAVPNNDTKHKENKSLPEIESVFILDNRRLFEENNGIKKEIKTEIDLHENQGEEVQTPKENTYKSKSHLITNHFQKEAKILCQLCKPPKPFVVMHNYIKHMMNYHSRLKMTSDNILKKCLLQTKRTNPSMSFNGQKSKNIESLINKSKNNESKKNQSKEQNNDQNDEFTDIEVLEEHLDEVFMLNYNAKGKDDILVQDVARSDHSYTQDTPVKIQSNSCSTVNKKTNLNYLPSGLTLPDLTKMGYPINMEIPQMNRTTIYIRQNSSKSKLWVANFDLNVKKCELCKTPMEKIGLYLRHRVMFHFFPANTYTCVCCKKTFETSDARRHHTLYCTEKSKLDVSFCYICQTQLDDYLSFRLHLLSYHPNKCKVLGEKRLRMCPLCNKEINLRTTNMSEHIRSHINPKPFKCAHCPTSKRHKRILLNHLTLKHFNDLAKHKCIECSPVTYFNETAVYLNHRKSVHAVVLEQRAVKNEPQITNEKVPCPQCSKLCNKSNLEKHILQFHKSRDELMANGYPCDVCGNLYATTSSLLLHKSSHVPETQRPHKCQYCGKGFNSRTVLQEHERDHTGEKPHVCPYCTKAFAKKQTFRDHVNTHTGNGYKCDHCDKTLWDHSSFRKHLKGHENKLGIKLTYSKEERRWAEDDLLDKVKDLL